MTKKISETIISVTALVLATTIIMIIAFLYDYFTILQFKNQKNELILAAYGIEKIGDSYFDNFKINDYRLTLIAQNGDVLFDSKKSSNEMENHLDRVEIQSAIKDGYGESERYSSTLSEKTIYSAKKLSDGKILRISSTQLTAISLISEIINPVLIISVLTLLLCIILSKRLSKKIIAPLENLDLDNPLQNEVYDELSPLLVKLDKQNKKVISQLANLTQKNKEITYITENVSDGILLLNEKGRVISANKKVKSLLECKENQYYLDFCRKLNYQKSIESALSGKNSVCKMDISGQIYKLSANTIMLEDNNFAVFIFISDITEEEKSYNIRREFSANVSHELKTPLSSILGIAEIIENGIVKPDDIPYFIKKIHSEAKRLLSLIQDIIKLSQLDEGNINMQFQKINVYKICKDIEMELIEKAKCKKLLITIHQSDIEINGLLSIVYEMIFNIIDNAIIYNKENGTVDIIFESDDNYNTIVIIDSGIGIAKEDKERVFERFYRVDKSHSKETGGTGLGLSIVKHGAEVNNAKLEIESEIGEGTTIKIKFPKKQKIKN